MLTLTSPLMLLGLGFLALPILAHLINRRARRRLVFPSIALLVESSASQSRLFKLRRLILLALRCLAVFLIVLAFARPLWRELASAGAASDDGAAVVLLVDVSASTAQLSSGVAAIDRLRTAASRVVDSLEWGADAVNLVLASSRPRAVFPSMTSNLDVVRSELDAMTPTAERADLAAAISLAGSLLAERDGRRHLFVFSDLQQSNWFEVEERLAAEKPLPEDALLTIVPPATPAPANVSLTAPSILPRTPLANEPAQASVQVANHGSEPRTVEIDVELDGEGVSTKSVRLEPRQKREVLFNLRFAAVGDHRVTFSTRSDALQVDDRAFLVARVGGRVRIVVLGDEDPEEPGNATYFTLRALAPRGDVADRYDVRLLRSSALTIDSLARASAVIVARVNELETTALEALHGYLDRGGGVAFFCDDGPAAWNLLKLDQFEERGLLPWRPGDVRELPPAEPIFLDEGDWRAAVLADFDERSQLAFSRIPFTRVGSADPVSPEARILLRFADGTPALGSRMVGLGKLIVANFSPSVRCGDLGKYGTFVALVHSLVRDLGSTSRPTKGALVGAHLTLDVTERFDRDGGTFELRRPDGRPTVGADLQSVSESLSLSIQRTEQPGFYTAVQGDREIGVAAVNPDGREGDLRRIDGAVLRRQLESLGSRLDVRELADDSASSGLRGRPLWGWLVVLAMAALGIELTLLGVWNR